MTGRRAERTGGGSGDEGRRGRARSFGVPDYASLFRGYDGPPAAEDGFCRPFGTEDGADAGGKRPAS